MKVWYCPIQMSLILSRFQTEGTDTNFEGFVWDAIKLWFLLSPSGIAIQSLIFGMRASFRILHKNMAWSYHKIKKKFWRHHFRTLLYLHVKLHLSLFPRKMLPVVIKNHSLKPFDLNEQLSCTMPWCSDENKPLRWRDQPFMQHAKKIASLTLNESNY